jgi:hypothetical protein
MARTPDKAPPPVRPPTHDVTVVVAAGKIAVTPCCIHAGRGDLIRWHVDGRRPFAAIVKAWDGPLNWDFFTLDRGGTVIEAVIAPDAKPGFYPYALVAPDGDGLLVADPEIIIPVPKGGRGS